MTRAIWIYVLTMTIDELAMRLDHHANLPSASSPDGSFCYLLFKARTDRQHVDLIIPFQDAFECLVELNKAWNGPIPSATPRARIRSVLDRRIAYSVGLIVTDAIGYALHCSAGSGVFGVESRVAAKMAFAISCAWDGVLAGDIDDLRLSVRLELEAEAPGESAGLL